MLANLWPARGELYRWFVSAVDGDGNELAGIRHPDVAVPLATYTGHNVRHPDAGAAGELVPMAGATYPFPATSEERHATADPRPAIEERYPNREAYMDQVRCAAEAWWPRDSCFKKTWLWWCSRPAPSTMPSPAEGEGLHSTEE